jgi:hypothetical protein
MAVAKLTLSFLDSQNSTSRLTIPLASIDSTNFDSSLAQAVFATAGTIAHLIAAVSIGAPMSSEIAIPANKLAAVPPANKFAQRELALQVSYSDDVTGKKYHMSIPAPDWETIGVPGSNKVNTSAAAWIALVTGLEAGMVSEVGNPIHVTGGKLIGRKSGR